MDHVGKLLDLLGRVGRFVDERARRPAAHDEVRFDAGAAQPLQQSHPENGAARAGDADDQAFRRLDELAHASIVHHHPTRSPVTHDVPV